LIKYAWNLLWDGVWGM